MMSIRNNMRQENKDSFTVIGISGPSGSGKTTVSRNLQQRLSKCVILQQDSYFKSNQVLGNFDNFCDLNCLHLDQFIHDITLLVNGNVITVPDVDLNTFEQIGYKIIRPARYILVEGMTIFRIREIYPLFKYRFYLSPGIEEIRLRKINRDLNFRNKTQEEIDFQLSWVEQEYNHDIENMQPEISLIQIRDDVEKLCEEIFNQIVRTSIHPFRSEMP